MVGYNAAMNQPNPQETARKTTIESLLDHIDQFLEANPHITEESFGWFSCKQSNLLERLRDGGDITTRRLDSIIAFMANPVLTHRKDATHGTQAQSR